MFKFNPGIWRALRLIICPRLSYIALPVPQGVAAEESSLDWDEYMKDTTTYSATANASKYVLESYYRELDTRPSRKYPISAFQTPVSIFDLLDFTSLTGLHGSAWLRTDNSQNGVSFFLSFSFLFFLFFHVIEKKLTQGFLCADMQSVFWAVVDDWQGEVKLSRTGCSNNVP